MARFQRDILLGFFLIGCLSVYVMGGALLRPLDRALYDAQLRWMRNNTPGQLVQDAVIIGIDEATYEAIPEPYALWHRHLGDLLKGLAVARPSVVGFATPLPVRSYEFIKPGIDAPLVDGLKRLREVTPIVVGQPIGLNKKLRPIAPDILAALGDETKGRGNLASLVICEDEDGVVRRLHQQRCISEDKREPLAHVMARHLGREGSPSGMIDFRVGARVNYLPMREVLDWVREGKTELLKEKFAGRPVIIGSMLPTEVHYRLPVALIGWEDKSRMESDLRPAENRTAPATIVHVQALRALMGPGLIERLSDPLKLTAKLPNTRELAAIESAPKRWFLGELRDLVRDPWMKLMAFAAAFFWLGRNSWKKSLLFGATLLGILALSTQGIRDGYYMFTGTLLSCFVLAFASRLVWEASRHYREKVLLRRAFAGHVSPQVMKAILGGEIQPDEVGQHSRVTILFSDIRGFTARSEQAPPAEMIALLNRFFNEAATAIHSKGGSIDKYIGDGILATFGIPQPLVSPERNALEAAQEILIRLAHLNKQLVAEGQQPLEIGIGIHSGEVLAGYVGSRKRRDFTIIGDTVNTASRLEGITKTVGYPVVCSNEVAVAVGRGGGLVDLGPQEIKGRSAVHVWGWSPPLLKRAGGGGGV